MKKTLLVAVFLLGHIISFAQGNDEKAVAEAVERIRVAIIGAKEADLMKLTSPKLTYGHSNGLLEDQKEFIRALVSEESKFTKIELSEQTITISGDVALVRHKLMGDTHNKGKEPAAVRLGVLMVLQKISGQWVLIGRQAFKLV
ncbi:nuclear transport factor 2 family protein [Dyadobacter sp. LJ53]|uniref:nuclear transport factor 2 family protein n=1 Tax=Dyadobacter chenwenxiniae TaxID=2906456 RepID=UPI001F26AE12|nr:nuclear transport factor 2 family protein [Dyadobacter chenwenxiniae]MCF0050093.1 nuclear transport factor 2 family protein [Dyadobacter chenwenxiniae]